MSIVMWVLLGALLLAVLTLAWLLAQVLRQQADVRNLVDVPGERGRRGCEVGEVGGMARHPQVRMRRENRIPSSQGDDLRAPWPSEPGHDDAAERLGRVGEGHGHEGRADARRAEVAPEWRTGAAGGILETAAAAVGIRREGEDAVAGRVQPGEKRRPRRRREGRNSRPERSEGSLARQPGQRRELSLREQIVDEVVVGPSRPRQRTLIGSGTLVPFGV
ncbi:MAG TPA: hypothetical protein VD695_04485 [Gaiellaceae bacterium]|nr:hypothetical protein [Gaiellaceae bacterium]